MITLDPKGDHAHIIPLGDMHIGHKNCAYERILDIVEFVKVREDYWVIGMGDYMDLGMVEGSPGKSNYEQNLTSQVAFKEVVKVLRPIQDRIICLLPGHHEDRVARKTGIDVTELLAGVLDVPYPGWVFYDEIKVGEYKYKVVAKHGNTSARTLAGKMRACMDLQNTYTADVYIYGHSHELSAFSSVVYNFEDGIMRMEKRWFVLTGHFLNYWGSYAQEREMKPGKMGVAKIELFKDRKDVHVKV